jgi:hypothetical protein
MQYGNFEFIEFTEPRIRNNGGLRKRALFKCECGDVREYDFTAVKTGHTKKCRLCGNKNLRDSVKKHNLIKHPLYKKWADMKKRCFNPKVDRYNSYGALGITVCDDWKNNFKSFYDWSIENGWEEGLTIERNDVNGNYCPENCCYIPLSEQKYNLKNTFYVEYKGVKIPLKRIHNESSFKVFGTIYTGSRKGRDFDYYVNKIEGFKEYLDSYIEKIKPN